MKAASVIKTQSTETDLVDLASQKPRELSKASKKKTNFEEVSSVHQLYQDLFITDMKDEIAIASNEVGLLRRVLVEKENENTLLKSKI